VATVLNDDATGMEPPRLTYIALVAALRAEFHPMQLAALNADLRHKLHGGGTIGIYAQAVHDAADPGYDVDAQLQLCPVGTQTYWPSLPATGEPPHEWRLP
jgi:hypothetical protein